MFRCSLCCNLQETQVAHSYISTPKKKKPDRPSQKTNDIALTLLHSPKQEIIESINYLEILDQPKARFIFSISPEEMENEYKELKESSRFSFKSIGKPVDTELETQAKEAALILKKKFRFQKK